MSETGIAPLDADGARRLARWAHWVAGRSGDTRYEAFADAMIAEAEAVEVDDQAAWLDAVAAQTRALHQDG